MSTTAKVKDSPLMQQFNRIKAKHPDALLLFRVGDFYETFGEDAIKAANTLGIVLTKRGNGSASEIELAGFPYHALDTYLPKLVRGGYRVAICEQLEDPKTTKTIVKRGVTELITPGVASGEKMLDHKANNYLASVHFDAKHYGVAFLDVSTGEFFVAEGDKDYIENVLQRFQPSEIILPKGKTKEFRLLFGTKFYTYGLDEWIYAFDFTRDLLLRHFETQSLKGFGVEDLAAGTVAAGAIIHYLGETQHANLKHISSLTRLEENHFVWLDKFSVRNLELLGSTHQDGKSLLDILDHTITPMGSRLLRKWIIMPLKEPEQIRERLSITEHFIKEQDVARQLRGQIKQVGDLERLIARIPLGKVSPRDLVQLKRSLKALEPVKQLMGQSISYLQKLSDQLNPCPVLIQKLQQYLIEDAPPLLAKGNVIAAGVNAELDELRHIVNAGKDLILDIQKSESERTGISSLKVGFNNVFGYYLEVTHTHKNKVPTEWIRKQTLVNAERYITPELKQYEEKILGAEEKIQALEEQLFRELVAFIYDYIQPVQLNAKLVARLDCLLCFSEVSQKNNYRKPEINNSFIIDIRQGRHPVIEQQLPPDTPYVPNDIFLDSDSQQIIMITGPNMAGKSAVLRQTALIVLMAQMGCFVPAEAAKIGVVDKIFTRVGASDNISSGESTFMVEMNETASIINNISERSLILLDEIGRGTSTYDGISIAWSLAEYLHNNPVAHAKTLFATHYHELNELAERFERIKNFNISTREAGNKVIFLRKLVEGGSKHSFGIHVAKMAGMPKPIIDRANEILHQLEQKSIGNGIKEKLKNVEQKNFQLSFFSVDDPKFAEARQLLNSTDINTLTPVEAMMRLDELKRLLQN